MRSNHILTQFCFDSRLVHFPGGKSSSWNFLFYDVGTKLRVTLESVFDRTTMLTHHGSKSDFSPISCTPLNILPNLWRPAVRITAERPLLGIHVVDRCLYPLGGVMDLVHAVCLLPNGLETTP